jgi:RNA recognition motif-containing protein
MKIYDILSHSLIRICERTACPFSGQAVFFFFTKYGDPPMDTKLYVGNLSYKTTEDDLRTLFSDTSTVVSVALIKDRETGRSKGFAFVELSSQTEAEQAIKDLNGKMVGDREIKVDKAKPPKDNYRSY